MTYRCRFASLVFAAATGAVVFAQTPAPEQPAPAQPAAEGQQNSAIPVTSAAESLNLRFANGIVAQAEDKIITVADVMREIIPYQQQIRNEVRTQKEFDAKMEQLEDEIIQSLIDRALIIKEFYKDEKRRIPVSYIDNEVADRIVSQFDNDQAKFLAYLRAQGKTRREYRRDIEEEIIYGFMRGQQRKSETIVSPVRIENFYNENKERFFQEDQVHLRLIQLSRADGATDESLLQRANVVLGRLKGGEKFDDLAREYSGDTRRSKGGDWGWQKRSDFRQEFSDKAFNLKKGEASEPILLPEGCFILYVEDRKYAGIRPIDDVRDEIEQILVMQMSRTHQERWLERLRRNGYVKHY